MVEYSSSKIHIFAGPTISEESILKLIPDATIHPPAKTGDIIRVLVKRPQLIVLIDGYYETEGSVWHKEILLALSMNVKVIGCSSIGAIRASELNSYGMIGSGRIYDNFCSGLFRDDHVAILHYDNCQYHTYALADVYFSIKNAVSEKSVDHEFSELCYKKISELPFYSRTEKKINQLFPDRKSDIEKILKSHFINQKKNDAIETLKNIHNLSATCKPTKFFISKNIFTLIKEIMSSNHHSGLKKIMYRQIVMLLMTLFNVKHEKSEEILYLAKCSSPRKHKFAPKLTDIELTINRKYWLIFRKEYIVDKSNISLFMLRNYLWSTIRAIAGMPSSLNRRVISKYLRMLAEQFNEDDYAGYIKQTFFREPEFVDIVNDHALFKYMIIDTGYFPSQPHPENIFMDWPLIIENLMLTFEKQFL